MTVTIRRRRVDVALGRFLCVGQVFRDRESGDLYRVRQVHRVDCEVELAPDWLPGPVHPLHLTFEELRRSFLWIANTPRQEPLCPT